MDEPEIEIEEQPDLPPSLQIEGEAQPRRLKGSGFTIVINTNKRPQGNTERQRLEDEIFRRADLLQAMERMRRTPELRRRLFKFLPPFQNDSFSSRFISRVIFDKPTTEVGTTRVGGRVHGNMSIRVTHFTKIHVNRSELEQAILGLLFNQNIQSLHINIRAFNLNAVTLSRYARKEQETEKGRRIASLSERLAQLAVNQ